jgi:hypothetical protein
MLGWQRSSWCVHRPFVDPHLMEPDLSPASSLMLWTRPLCRRVSASPSIAYTTHPLLHHTAHHPVLPRPRNLSVLIPILRNKPTWRLILPHPHASRTRHRRLARRNDTAISFNRKSAEWVRHVGAGGRMQRGMLTRGKRGGSRSHSAAALRWCPVVP